MSFPATAMKALSIGTVADDISKEIWGGERSVERSVTSTTVGTGLGYVAAELLVVGIGSSAAAPVVVPLAIAAGAVSLFRSLMKK